MKMVTGFIPAILILVGAGAGPAAYAAPDNHFVVLPDEVKWIDATVLPPGAKIAVLWGDPKTGPFVQRVKFPPNYRVPAHTHPDERIVTVISGTLYHGEGERFDPAKLKRAPAGTVFGEGHTPHFGMTKDEEVVIQVQGPGPTATIYVDIADDPRKK